MTYTSILAVWSKVRMVLEVLDQAAAYDPLEEQQRRMAKLEKRLARLEVEASQSSHCPSSES